MKPAIKRRWVDALRSGKYEQGRGLLCHDGRFCCLGVLCELAAEDGVVERQPRTDGAVVFDRTPNAGLTAGLVLLPAAVMAWAGLDVDYAGRVVIGGKYEPIPDHNDDGGASFDELADAIEAQL